MKKILCLVSAVLLVFTSCSKDDSANIILIRQIESSGEISSYSYNGNKINQITNNKSKTVITYTGDLITKEETFTDNVLNFNVEFVYENNKFKSISLTDGVGALAYKRKEVYTYNADGTISYNTFEIDATSGIETLIKSGKYTFSNGNMIKDENSSQTSIYEYDTKNNPFKNVVGFEKFIDSEISVNNVVKEKITDKGSSTPHIRGYQYQYNSDGFPVERTYSWDGVPYPSETTKYKY